MFNRPFSFDGRIRRTEFGVSFIIYIVCATFLNLIVADSRGDAGILGLAYIPLLWFLWAQGAKRCHDIGNSGWWQLIPFYGLWMLFQDGQRYPNEYGDNPKGINDHDNPFPYQHQEANSVNTVAEQPKQAITIENTNIGKTIVEVRNASYSNVQEVIRQIRAISSVSQLSYEYDSTTGTITVQHSGSSQKLLEDFMSINPTIQVISITNGHISIKLT